jgi:hypothetical protein
MTINTQVLKEATNALVFDNSWNPHLKGKARREAAHREAKAELESAPTKSDETTESVQAVEIGQNTEETEVRIADATLVDGLNEPAQKFTQHRAPKMKNPTPPKVDVTPDQTAEPEESEMFRKVMAKLDAKATVAADRTGYGTGFVTGKVAKTKFGKFFKVPDFVAGFNKGYKKGGE